MEEDDDEQRAATQLTGTMTEHTQDPNSFKRMKTELKKHFEERVVI